MDVQRRRILLASAAAAAQTAWGQAGKVKTAVIGTGNRGSYLLQGVLEQPDAEVAAVCDIKPDRLDKAATAAKRDNPKTYTDWKQIIDRKDIEAVYVATPPHLHSEMAVAALKSGKHVYCEKPVGVTAAQVRRWSRPRAGRTRSSPPASSCDRSACSRKPSSRSTTA
jgi:myo-inositol 2-dehydrogenase/D-chiro-inositol 1-dehydrogenase